MAIENLMEEAATVEISRMQLWQWIRHRVATLDGVQVTRELVASMLDEEVERLREQLLAQAHDRVAAARDILERSCLEDDFPSFVTLDVRWRRGIHEVGCEQDDVARRLANDTLDDGGERRDIVECLGDDFAAHLAIAPQLGLDQHDVESGCLAHQHGFARARGDAAERAR